MNARQILTAVAIVAAGIGVGGTALADTPVASITVISGPATATATATPVLVISEPADGGAPATRTPEPVAAEIVAPATATVPAVHAAKHARAAKKQHIERASAPLVAVRPMTVRSGRR